MTTTLEITNSGLVAAQSAASSGIRVKLATFRVGSAFGYTPVPTDTALHGTTLYTGVVTGFTNLADGSLLISCVLPAGTGPFDFGEVGIYTDTGALFALGALPALVKKFSSLSSGFGSTYTFNALLRLGNATTIIQVPAPGPAYYPIQYASTWLSVVPADLTAPPVYQLIVSEPDNKGDYSTLVRKADGSWSVQTNFTALRQSASLVDVAADKSFVTITLGDWAFFVPGDVTVSKGAVTSFVVQAPNGRFCSAVASLAGSKVQFTFSAPFTVGDLAPGQLLRLYSNYYPLTFPI